MKSANSRHAKNTEEFAPVRVRERGKQIPIVVSAKRKPDKVSDTKVKKRTLSLRPLQSQYYHIIGWISSLKQQYGSRFLWQVFSVYFTQGIRSTLCSLGTSYFLNDTLVLLPSQSEALRGTASIPWIIKPLYGILSDSVPICGTRRKSYLLAGSAITALAYLLLAIPNLLTSYETALMALVLASFGVAFCDVVIDGRVVEASRNDREDMAVNLQTLSWLSMSFGSLFGSIISGQALTALGPRGVFFLSALGPICTISISCRIHEEPLLPLPCGFFATVRTQFSQLAGVFVTPACWRPVLWLFLSNALAPSVGEAMFSFKTKELRFTKSFLGFVSTIGSLTLLGTTALYSIHFRNIAFRKIFFGVQIVSAAVSFSEFVLVARWNTYFGVNDQFFIFGDEIVSDVVARLKHMPSLILCAKICPPGIEGTMFALLMSIYNFSWSVASYGGSWLCQYLSVSSQNFVGLPKALLVRSFAKLIPVMLLWMIPATINVQSTKESVEMENVSNLEAGNAKESKAFA
uniref:FolateBiopterin Transporter (FBT) Family putative n=1 Tax=Albugo laibachii Nc14 TaxID=890382 RepID=F0WZ09_9STRA|nr:FolateBiopterin Transporter (FBT) Family putative [Albugo laibachii Nc14]|eukprot:CCA26723.1 FolateBiopterin Transporter (FBT) Family putative [Albugo laibachii Nc14]